MGTHTFLVKCGTVTLLAMFSLLSVPSYYFQQLLLYSSGHPSRILVTLRYPLAWTPCLLINTPKACSLAVAQSLPTCQLSKGTHWPSHQVLQLVTHWPCHQVYPLAIPLGPLMHPHDGDAHSIWKSRQQRCWSVGSIWMDGGRRSLREPSW